MDTNAKNGPSLQRIHYISLTVLAFEAMVIILFSLSSAGRIETLNLLLLAFTALLAGTGAGIFPDSAAAVRQCLKAERSLEPDPANAARYAALFQQYRAIHDALAPCYRNR